MKNRIVFLSIFMISFLFACKKESNELSSGGIMTTGEGSSQGGNLPKPGLITAGEWNDLNNWGFWDSIIAKDNYKELPSYWSIFNNNRIAVRIVSDDSLPAIDALVQLKRNGNIVYTARTDNKGNAELWVDLFQSNSNVDYTQLSLDINEGSLLLSNVKSYKEGINNVILNSNNYDNNIEIAFVVDATGSMGDELEYLKTELVDVITRVKLANPNSTILTSSVFYRDAEDNYVTKVSNFTSDYNTTNNFIKNQSADGGGDFPEAVHSALDKAVNELQWSVKAKTKIMFLVLDAPPHHKNDVISSVQNSVQKATEKGIKIIPITASGIDKETEFLMRFLSMSTNGTYVFITNHSGIGNNHLEATVGAYQVEYLNDLMVRLINKYSE